MVQILISFGSNIRMVRSLGRGERRGASWKLAQSASLALSIQSNESQAFQFCSMKSATIPRKVTVWHLPGKEPPIDNESELSVIRQNSTLTLVAYPVPPFQLQVTTTRSSREGIGVEANRGPERILSFVVRLCLAFSAADAVLRLCDVRLAVRRRSDRPIAFELE
jgi:hypothetical protein